MGTPNGYTAVGNAEANREHAWRILATAIKSAKSLKNMELFKHQTEGIAFLKERKKAILADEMGLGKTRQAILAAGGESTETVLVVCPSSLKINWEREIHMVYPENTVLIVSGGKAPEAGPLPAWIVINYDILGKHKEWLQEAVGGMIETIIFDEAHYLKNTASIRTKAAMTIAADAQKVYCLTGTPVMNRPIELFSLLWLTGHPIARAPGRAPSALRRSFSERYCDGKMRVIFRRGGGTLRFWEESGATRLPELKELTKSVFLRRTKKEVLDLPEKIVSVVETELDAIDKNLYDRAWDDYMDYIAANPLKGDIDNIMNAQGLVELIKLKQVCSQAKIPRIIADIENAVEQGQKVIVFSQFTHTIEVLAMKLRALKIGNVTLTGADKMEDRQKSVDAFQNDDSTKVFISNIKAGGVGLTLTAASIVMFADMDWSPETHRQAEDRAHRIGQTGTVNIYYYVMSGTIEEDIVDILTKKQETIGVLTGGETTIKAFMDLIIKRVAGEN